jgi:GxxExxY protein
MAEKEFCRRCTRMHADEIWTNEPFERNIGCALRVLNTLGTEFLEKVYENTLADDMREAGPSVEQQKDIIVCYNADIVVGVYITGL